MNIKHNGMIRALTALIIMLAVAPSKAYNIFEATYPDAIYSNGITYHVISEERREAEVFWCPYSAGSDIVIPAKLIHNGLTYSVTSIGNSAFSDNDELKSVVIPNSVTSIGYHAFNGCSGLTSVVIPNSITSIGTSTFYNCSGLTSVVIPNSVTSIGNSAFRGCDGLTSVVIPNSVTSIGNGAFSGCSGLTSVVIGNSVTSIGDGAFNYCDGLTSVVIGNSVTSIGEYAFYYCDGLTSVVIPNSVTSIGEYAFWGCSGLTSIVIGKGITSIGEYAFAGTGTSHIVSSVYCMAENPLTNYNNNFFGGRDCRGTLFVPKGTKAAYSSAEVWKDFQNIVEIDEEDFPSGITSVAAEDGFTVTTDGNTINVSRAGSRRIYVYASDGQCVYSGTGTTITNLPGGIYIVKCGNRTKKVAL